MERLEARLDEIAKRLGVVANSNIPNKQSTPPKPKIEALPVTAPLLRTPLTLETSAVADVTAPASLLMKVVKGGAVIAVVFLIFLCIRHFMNRRAKAISTSTKGPAESAVANASAFGSSDPVAPTGARSVEELLRMRRSQQQQHPAHHRPGMSSLTPHIEVIVDATKEQDEDDEKTDIEDDSDVEDGAQSTTPVTTSPPTIKNVKKQKKLKKVRPAAK